MARTNNLTNFLTDVATSIKAKTGDSSLIPASQFDTKIAGIKLSNEEYTKANNNLDEILYQSQNVLPNTYQEVEYLEASGTQYIDTGVNGDCLVELDCQGTLKNTVSQIVIGSYTSRGSFFGQYLSTGKYGFANNEGLTNIDYDERAMFNIHFSSLQSSVTVNNQTYTVDVLDPNENNYTLFRAKEKANKNYYYANAKIYSCKFSKDGILVRNFIPCYRKSDNEAGMYDTVNNVFYTNAGDGEFIVGADVDVLNTKIESILTEKKVKVMPEYIKNGINILGVNGVYTGNLTDMEYAKANADLDNILYQSENVLPDAYQQVEYLESTGTQYINTGVNYANDLLVKDKVLYTVLDDDVISTKTIYRISGVSATLYWGVGKRGNTSAWTWCAGSVTSVPVQTHTKYNLEINMSTNEVYANGVLVGSRSATSTGTGNMYLFASKSATKDEVNSSEYDIRRYGTEIYKSGILIRNFVPCYRKSDNEAGMYDTVNNVFYTNDGTGDFIVGADVDILNSKIESILTEKIMKIIPENIKSGVNILGIIGTYTGN